MKNLKLKNVVPAIVLATVLVTPTVFANGITDGSIPCQDVAQNEEAYGCVQDDDSQALNKKYQCIKALSAFEVPFLDEGNEFSKPGKIKKDADMTAMGDADGSIKFSDKDKDFKVDKAKIKQAILAKYGQEAQDKEEFKVTFQTLEGKMTLKFKKKPGQNLSDRADFDIGKWEHINNSHDTENNALVALGSSNEVRSSGTSDEAVKDDLDEKVTKFPENVDKKLEEIEEKYAEKEREVDQNNDLSSMEKIAHKRALRAEKDQKKAVWQGKKVNMDTILAHARRKCANRHNSTLISENVLTGSGTSAGSPGRGIAQAE